MAARKKAIRRKPRNHPLRKKATRKKAARKRTAPEPRHPKVGDVISCRLFASAHCAYEQIEVPAKYAGLKRAEKKSVELDRARLTVGAGGRITGFQKVTGIDQDGDRVQIDKGEYHWNNNCPDKSRGTALFVVERTAFDGGGTGHGPHDIYPDGHHAWARRLRDDGSYDPIGEVIEFYTSGCFNCQIEPEDIQYHKKRMRAVMVPE